MRKQRLVENFGAAETINSMHSATNTEPKLQLTDFVKDRAKRLNPCKHGIRSV